MCDVRLEVGVIVTQVLELSQGFLDLNFHSISFHPPGPSFWVCTLSE
jgi:hypothetical protein